MSTVKAVKVVAWYVTRMYQYILSGVRNFLREHYLWSCPILSFLYVCVCVMQKKDAEEIRQHCDTLNNILLAEFDYFSKTMIDDFELMTVRLLKQQADFHRRVRILSGVLLLNFLRAVSGRVCYKITTSKLSNTKKNKKNNLVL